MEKQICSFPQYYRSYKTDKFGVVVPSTSFEMKTAPGSFTGTINPAWRGQVQRHENATTPMDAIWYSRAWRSWWYRAMNVSTHPSAQGESVECRGTYSTFPVDFATPPLFSGEQYTTARNNAIGKLYDRIRYLESMSNIGEDLGEISQTYRMASRPLSGILDLTAYTVNNHIDLLKKSKWNNVKQTAKGLANVALEYRFGIKPLIRSAAEAYVAVGNRDEIFYYMPFDVYGVGKGLATPIDTGRFVIQNCGLQYCRIRTNNSKVRYRGEYQYTSGVDRASLTRSLGLTWREAPVTLYNLIPYSFLLDYVLNLNQFVEALAVPWNKIAWCNLTEKTWRSEYQSIHQDERAVSASVDMRFTLFRPSFARLDSHRTRRSAQTNIPMPWLQVKKPNQRQKENVLALVASRLPVVNRLSKAVSRSGHGSRLEQQFKLVTRDRNLKIPYPSFTF